jgi:hypothetical protein
MKKSKGALIGEQMADSLISWIHLMYQLNTAKRVLNALINRLSERKKEFEK